MECGSLSAIPVTFEPLEADRKHSAAEVPCVKTKAPMTPNVDKGPTYPVAAPELVNFLAGRRGFCALSRTCQVKRKKVGGAKIFGHGGSPQGPRHLFKHSLILPESLPGEISDN